MSVVIDERRIGVDTGQVLLEGDLHLVENASGPVLFAHGSGSSRHSPRNRLVAATLNEHGFSTLLFDLLTAKEERIDQQTRHLRFDITLLAERMIAAIDWAAHYQGTRGTPIGCFGASIGAAAALMAAAERPDRVRAVVSRGGRPDLADLALFRVKAATLLIVGGDDPAVIEMNQSAYALIRSPKKLEIIPGSGHLFEEPGALERVANLAADWFSVYLRQ